MAISPRESERSSLDPTPSASQAAILEAALAKAQYESSSTIFGTNNPVEILQALLTFTALPYRHAHLGLMAFEDTSGLGVQEAEQTLQWLAEADGRGKVSSSILYRVLGDYPAFESLSAVEVLHIEAVDTDPFLTDSERTRLRSQGIGGLLIVPLVVNQRLIGVVSIEQDSSTPIDARRLRALRRLSDQAAVVLENARLLQDAQKRADQLTLQVRSLQSINKLATALSTFSDDNALMDYAARQMVEALEVDHTGLMMINDDMTGTIVSEYPSIGAKGSRLSLVDNPLQKMIMAQFPNPILVNHIDHNTLLTEETRTLLQSLGLKSFMVTPIIVDGRLVGTFGLDIYSPDRVFTPEMAEFAQTMVSQLMIGLENLNLLREERERAEQSERVARNEALANQISARMQRTNNVETIVRDTVKALGEALHARQVRVRFAVEPTGTQERELFVGNGAGDHGISVQSHPDAPDEQWS